MALHREQESEANAAYDDERHNRWRTLRHPTGHAVRAPHKAVRRRLHPCIRAIRAMSSRAEQDGPQARQDRCVSHTCERTSSAPAWCAPAAASPRRPSCCASPSAPCAPTARAPAAAAAALARRCRGQSLHCPPRRRPVEIWHRDIREEARNLDAPTQMPMDRLQNDAISLQKPAVDTVS